MRTFTGKTLFIRLSLQERSVMIELSKVLTGKKPTDFGVQFGAYNSTGISSFKDVIYDELKRQNLEQKHNYDIVTTRIEGGTFSVLERNAFESQVAHADIKKDTPSVSLRDQFKKYKEDQLLLNPGGDYFSLDKDNRLIDSSVDQSKFNLRVGKDLRDAGKNFLNIFKDMGTGATFKYVAEDGHVQEGKKSGLGGTLIKFFKDIASGITFGKYTPENENAPHNALEGTKHFFKKIFVDALFKDVIVGVPKSAIHVGEDAVLACINLAETVPDATVGNFKAGQVATTEIFDDTQVFVKFLADVVPMGEASSRTRAFTFKKGIKGLPIVNNITTPEHGVKDENWRYVRNTPLRKTIESVATLIPFQI